MMKALTAMLMVSCLVVLTACLTSAESAVTQGGNSATTQPATATPAAAAPTSAPTTQPAATAPVARAISGTVIVGGDS